MCDHYDNYFPNDKKDRDLFKSKYLEKIYKSQKSDYDLWLELEQVKKELEKLKKKKDGK